MSASGTLTPLKTCFRFFHRTRWPLPPCADRCVLTSPALGGPERAAGGSGSEASVGARRRRERERERERAERGGVSFGARRPQGRFIAETWCGGTVGYHGSLENSQRSSNFLTEKEVKAGPLQLFQVPPSSQLQ